MPVQTFSIGKYKIMLAVSKAPQRPDIYNSYYTTIHSHEDCFECFVDLSGEITFEVNSKKYELMAGEILVIPPKINHRILNVSTDCLIPCIPFKLVPSPEADELSKMVGSCKKIKINDFVFALSKSIHNDQDAFPIFTEDTMNLKMQLFVAEIIRSIHEECQNNSAHNARNLKEKNEIIDNFFADPQNLCLSATDLADKLHISTRQLNRVLLTNYGVNFNAKLISHRIGYASWMLRNTDTPIEEIYEQIGYTSKSAFFKVFKENTGETPNQYRNSFFKVKKK